jgi:hypothetical protein
MHPGCSMVWIQVPSALLFKGKKIRQQINEAISLPKTAQVRTSILHTQNSFFLEQVLESFFEENTVEAPTAVQI